MQTVLEFVVFHHSRCETNPQEQPGSLQAVVVTSHFQPKPATSNDERKQ
jgi:hypothetical protein